MAPGGRTHLVFLILLATFCRCSMCRRPTVDHPTCLPACSHLGTRLCSVRRALGSPVRQGRSCRVCYDPCSPALFAGVHGRFAMNEDFLRMNELRVGRKTEVRLPFFSLFLSLFLSCSSACTAPVGYIIRCLSHVGVTRQPHGPCLGFQLYLRIFHCTGCWAQGAELGAHRCMRPKLALTHVHALAQVHCRRPHRMGT